MLPHNISKITSAIMIDFCSVIQAAQKQCYGQRSSSAGSHVVMAGGGGGGGGGRKRDNEEGGMRGDIRTGDSAADSIREAQLVGAWCSEALQLLHSTATACLQDVLT